MARKRTLKYEVDLDTRKAIKSADKLTDAAEDVEEGLEDVETAGKQVARALEQSADDMIDEIDATARAVEALDRELDDLDSSVDTRQAVAELKRIGLTAEDIEADADELAAALRRVDEVDTHAVSAGFDDVDQAIGRGTESTGRMRDTMGGFVGGAVGELPGVADAMGPVGEAAGQIAENLLEGSDNLGTLAAGAGAVGALGFAFYALNQHLTNVAETDAWKTEQVDEYTEAIIEAGDASLGVVAALREAEEITYRAAAGSGFLGLSGETRDVSDNLFRLGLDVHDFNDLVQGGQENLHDWWQAYLGTDYVEDASNVYKAAEQAIDNVAAAEEAAAISAEVFAANQQDVNKAWQDFVDDTDGVPELVDEFDRMAEALDAGVAPSLEDVQTVMERLNVDEAEAIRLADDHRQALRDQAEAADNLRRRVEDYSDELGGIPDDIETEILALIDEGDLARAEAKLTHLTRYREITIGLTGAGAPFAGGSDFFFARGGTTGPQGGVAGENYRPELVDGRLVTGPTAVPAATKVTGEAETRRMLASRPTVTRHVTVNVGPGYGPEDIERITRTYDQQNGRRRVS